MAVKPFGTRPPAVQSERRRAKRDPLAIAVSLYSVSQSRVVLLLDVSPTGARFGGEDLPGTGKDVLLKVAGVELFGTVVRCAAEEAAIRFERPIGQRELQALQAAVADQAQVTMLHAR